MAKRAPKLVKNPPVTEVPVLALGPELRIGQAAAVYASLAANAGSKDEVLIDGAAVVRVDVAGLQAVLVAVVELRTAGTKWRWHNPSPALKHAARILALDTELGLE